MLVLKVLVAAGRACTPGSSSTSEEGPGNDDDAAEKAQREKEATFSCSAGLPQGIRAVTREKIPIALRPKLWDKPHAESFWELFYDLIIVVAFIRISSGKHNLTGWGIATTSAIYLNFWSSWMIVNIYATAPASVSARGRPPAVSRGTVAPDVARAGVCAERHLAPPLLQLPHRVHLHHGHLPGRRGLGLLQL